MFCEIKRSETTFEPTISPQGSFRYRVARAPSNDNASRLNTYCDGYSAARGCGLTEHLPYTAKSLLPTKCIRPLRPFARSTPLGFTFVSWQSSHRATGLYQRQRFKAFQLNCCDNPLNYTDVCLKLANHNAVTAKLKLYSLTPLYFVLRHRL